MRRWFACACIAIMGSVAWAQSADPAPAFDISEIHSSPRAARAGSRGGVLRGDRWEIRNASLVDLIQIAYRVEPESVLGGPRWLEMIHYDITAKAPRGTPSEKVMLMVRKLLADRFQLVVHEDKKDVPGFALVLGKGPHKMKKSADAEPDCKDKPTPKEAIGLVSVSCNNLTADMMVGLLHDAGGGGYFNGPLANFTKLEGSWDFDLQWTERNQLSRAGSDAITLFDAIEKQLGLKIEQRPVPSAVLVVDRVNEKPTANEPGVDEKLAPARAREFDVATIKPNPGPVGQINVGIQDGRLEARAASLRQLIAIAWDVPANRISGPDAALDGHGFDVVAKAAVDPVAGLDIEEFRQMLRGLLIDRFEMKIQMEDREMPAYTLVAGKPKMAKADPANRTACKEGPAPASTQDARNKVLARNRLLTCRNITMKEFADQLDLLVSGYVKAPVLEATNLEGQWDFSLNFSGVNVLNAALAAQGPGGGLAADPNGAISLEDAVKDQLGLKLEMGKRPTPVLTVGKALESPTEN